MIAQGGLGAVWRSRAGQDLLVNDGSGYRAQPLPAPPPVGGWPMPQAIPYDAPIPPAPSAFNPLSHAMGIACDQALPAGNVPPLARPQGMPVRRGAGVV